MKLAFLFILVSLVIFSGMACKEVQKTSTSAGINMMVHDIPCEEVISRIVALCNQQRLHFEWADKDQSLLFIGPVTTSPLPSDPFLKMEEKIRLEIKCVDPLSTRISLRMQLSGWTSDNQWQDIKDLDKLNAYGKRFLDRLVEK